MIIKDTSPNPTIAVVACQHGNELFGYDVVQEILQHPDDYPGIRAIIANEPAIDNGVRYIDEDLNRAYPGNATTIEGNIAQRLLAEVSSCVYVFDIHTTYANIPFIPIITNTSIQTKKALQFIPGDRAILITSSMGRGALISHVFGGVSLEYGRTFAGTEGITHALSIIKHAISGYSIQSKIDALYIVDGMYPTNRELSKKGRDFEYNDLIQGYPCLLNEKAYVDAGFQCMVASRVESLELSS